MRNGHRTEPRRTGGRRRRTRGGAAALVAGLLLLAGCGDPMPVNPSLAGRTVPGGDPGEGRAILTAGTYGCGACHAIPGIPGARGAVGPPLHGMAVRSIVAGRLPNRPDTLVHWIHAPQSIDPRSAMPDTGISPQEAAHVAAYLYTLRELPR